MRHSPGPWRWGSDGVGGDRLRSGAGHTVLLIGTGGSGASEPSRADARLISLAPEMASLLKRMHKHLEGHWLADHDERCTNVLDANDRCPQAKCYCPRPDTLDECASLLSKIGEDP